MTSSSENQTNRTRQTQIIETQQASELLTITLTPDKRKKKKVVRWAADVIDNEFMNKKSSKACCIYHKPQKFGEWSDSDTDDEYSDYQPTLETTPTS
eukprot:g8705.t1